jgi:gluconate 2-dehydrogenase gamma chain
MGDETVDRPDAAGPVEAQPGRRISRLKLLQVGAVGAAGAAAGGVLSQPAEAKETKPPPLRFLTKWEFALVTAMAETIWPTDDLGPGARQAGVGYYIDGQLSAGWGKGHRFYLNGPFFTAADSGHGFQIPMTPADIYRAFLPAVDQYTKTKYGGPYETRDAATQTKVMNDLRAGTASVALAGSTSFTSADFFNMFRQNVLEGMLADPSYGGNKDMVGWKWVGFPGNPMRSQYAKLLFNDQPYPLQYKPAKMPQDGGVM